MSTAKIAIRPTWLDRALIQIAPGYAARRLRARVGLELLQRHYEGAAAGRRTQGWHRSSADANAAQGPALSRLRDVARDLVRNNPYAESAVSTIADHTIGWGIVGKPDPFDQKTADSWKRWADSTDCDADGRNDFAGLQKLVMRTVVESGEVLVRRRLRRLEDGFRIPMQLQVLDPDFLDTSKDGVTATGGRIIQGVEFNPIGQRVAYWLHDEHPGGATLLSNLTSRRIPADTVLHIFKSSRPGQVRAASWLAPVVLRFKDFDEFEDATLMKQKIAACLAVITSDVNGANDTLGTGEVESDIDTLEPGAIINAEPGRSIEVVQPPTAGDFEPYSKSVLRGIATGIGLTYEDFAGDYTDLPFSAARMSRLRHESRVTDWRWRLIIPQFCAPAYAWFLQVATIFGYANGTDGIAHWTAPPLPMVDPVNEGLAEQRAVRTGLKSWSESVRERGYDPDELAAEMAADFDRFDDLGLVLDCDPRRMTQAGQAQSPIGDTASRDKDAAAAEGARLHAVAGR